MPIFSLPDMPPSSRRLSLMTIGATALAVVVLIASAGLAHENLRRADIKATLSAQGHETELATELLLSALVDAETGLRGYLLTGNPTYLAPYAGARRRVEAAMTQLERTPFLDIARARHINDLRTLAASKLEDLDRTVQLRQSGQDQAALDAVRTGKGKQLMDAIRREIAALQVHTRAMLDQLPVQSPSTLDWAAVGSLALLGTLLLGLVVILQVRARRVAVAGLKQLREAFLAVDLADEERQHANALLQSIVETAPGLIYAKDRQGRMLIANAATLRLIGKPWEAVKGRTDREFLDDVAQGDSVMANDRRVMDTGRVEEMEELVGSEGGYERVWLSTKRPLKDAAGQVTGLVGVSIEITERKLNEERLRQMVNELNHRVKNTLATVQSIVSQTLPRSDPAACLTLEMRLMALASAHDALTREQWDGADLHEILNAILAPHGGLNGGRFRLAGVAVRLAPRAALGMTMGLHELVTNALKYGALSLATGNISIVWEVASGDTPQFNFVWQEHDGPRVTAPATRGFGTKVIERVLAQDVGGTAILEFRPAGLRCEIRAPLTEISAPAQIVPFPRVGVLGGT